MKANTGSSVNSDPKSAGREAAAKARAGLDNLKMVFVYASNDYCDLPAVLEGVREQLPGVPIVGHTSWRGVVLPEGFVGGSHFVGLMALADDQLTVSVASAQSEGKAEAAIEAGRQAALAAMKNAGRDCPPDYFYMAAMPGFEEYYLKGIARVIGRRPMFGGSAVDSHVTGDWDVYTHEGVVGYGLSLAFFYTAKPIVTHYTSAPYYETQERCVVTKMRNPRKLVSVEGLSLIDRIVENSGCGREFLRGGDLQMATILNPIGVKDRLGDLTALRFPMCLSADGTIDIASNIAEGTVIIHMKASAPDLVEAGGKEIETLAEKMEAVPAAYHLSMGFGRMMAIQDEGLREEAVRRILIGAGGAPFIMPLTLAEYGFVDDGMNTCGGLMLSYAGFPT